jgi:hypothetical protein
VAIIIKKRQVPETRVPAPLLPDPTEKKAPAPSAPVKATSTWRDLPVAKTEEEWAKGRGSLRPPEPTTCRLCEHDYAFPCHGESETCMNAKYAKARKEKAVA